MTTNISLVHAADRAAEEFNLKRITMSYQKRKEIYEGNNQKNEKKIIIGGIVKSR